MLYNNITNYEIFCTDFVKILQHKKPCLFLKLHQCTTMNSRVRSFIILYTIARILFKILRILGNFLELDSEFEIHFCGFKQCLFTYPKFVWRTPRDCLVLKRLTQCIVCKGLL